ncbi:DVU3141 family protein [Marinobacter sp. GN3S48]|uniref:DVU3141 family protein n=1 Tax=Marinobacter sp. GN3S48 TaxID=3382302 RepID=UPI00387B6FA4
MLKNQMTMTARLYTLTLSLLAFSGCASYPGGISPEDSFQTWTSRGSTVTYLPTDITPMLEKASVGENIVLGDTPWGKQARLTVNNRYFAASGKRCLGATLEASQGQERLVNVCRHKNDLWGATKSIRAAVPNGGAQ